MALRVIGPGFGRTGTASIKLALEKLGFGPCHHMEEVIKNPGQVKYWQAVAEGRPVDWDEVFAGYGSQIDWPGAHCWRELAAAYPDAKVLLTVRPEESWWNSFSATIGMVMSMDRSGMPLPPHMSAMMNAMEEIVGRQTFGGSTADRDAALKAYRQRIAEVRGAIPSERLLVFDVSQGWEPLCRFLGVPVPDEPFPHANTTADFHATVGVASAAPAGA